MWWLSGRAVLIVFLLLGVHGGDVRRGLCVVRPCLLAVTDKVLEVLYSTHGLAEFGDWSVWWVEVDAEEKVRAAG